MPEIWLYFRVSLLALCGGCSRKFAQLGKTSDARVAVALPRKSVALPEPRDSIAEQPAKEISYTTADGKELLLVPASYDEQLKESMMNLQIEQVTVSVSNFRNVAERNGKIDLEFSITVPRTLLDERWRVDLRPMLCTARDTFALKRLVLTGERFRRRQQQDMERYRHYLGSIVDSADFFAISVIFPVLNAIWPKPNANASGSCTTVPFWKNSRPSRRSSTGSCIPTTGNPIAGRKRR